MTTRFFCPITQKWIEQDFGMSQWLERRQPEKDREDEISQPTSSQTPQKQEASAFAVLSPGETIEVDHGDWITYDCTKDSPPDPQMYVDVKLCCGDVYMGRIAGEWYWGSAILSTIVAYRLSQKAVQVPNEEGWCISLSDWHPPENEYGYKVLERDGRQGWVKSPDWTKRGYATDILACCACVEDQRLEKVTYRVSGQEWQIQKGTNQ